MITHFRFVHPLLLVLLTCFIVALCLIRWFFRRRFVYTYSLADTIREQGYASDHPYEKIVLGLWALLLWLVAMIIARPQLCDTISKTRLDGIDIMLVLDISDSMRLIDDPKNPKPRITIAKEEALQFIENRPNDAIGLVLFAGCAISRCPFTHDKKIVGDIIRQTEIGLLDQRFTHLSTGLVTAANRLKGSTAKSKIIILLTDGAPSDGDIEPQVAVDIAKQLGIRVYTIGIGSKDFSRAYGFVPNQFYNEELLVEISNRTGGTFFSARNAQEMRSIYQTIDQLEKTKHEVQRQNYYEDVYVPFVVGALMILFVGVILSTFVWFAV